MTLYALVPVKVKISSNSAEEMERVHTLVKSVVEHWQELCIDAERDGLKDALKDWIEVRRPDDCIYIADQ